MKGYPFVKCLYPRRITNKYTHEDLVVPCGHCKACQTSKALRYKLQCDLERACHKYCIFITLTYSNEFLPTCELVSSEFDDTYLLVDADGVVFGSTTMSAHQRDMLLSKFNVNGKVPVLCKRDLQLFLKRLRKRIYNNCHEKVRFFAVGEYGPIHFRPHYHVLLYFSSHATLQKAYEYICSSWKYGRIDVQLSVADVSKYVSGYVNSFSSLPLLFQNAAVCPFNCHSQRLGQSYFEYLRPTIYEASFEEIISIRSVLNDTYQAIGTLPSVIALYFPRCRGYSYISAYKRAFLYKIYRLGMSYFPECSNCMELAKSVANMLYISNLTDKYNGYNSLFAQFCEVCSEGFPKGAALDSLDFVKFIDKLYRMFSLSRHFLEFCCADTKDPWYVLRRIDWFYKELDMRHLNDFLDMQSAFCDSDYADDDDYLFMYNNSIDPLYIRNTKVYGYYAADVDKTYNDNIKHKKLNDLNKIFNYG